MIRVTFNSEGETLIGNLFLPTSKIEGEKLPAVVVGGSWLTVKEQMASVSASPATRKIRQRRHGMQSKSRFRAKNFESFKEGRLTLIACPRR